MPNPVVHFEIISKNQKALETFYREAFDWQCDPPTQGAGIPTYTLIRPEANGITGGIGDLPPGYDGHVTFYIGVPDIEAALQTVERLGGKRMMGPETVPNGGPTIALFSDPENHTIGLVETPPT